MMPSGGYVFLEWGQDAERDLRLTTAVDQLDELVKVEAAVVRDTRRERLREPGPHELRPSPSEDLVPFESLRFRCLMLGCVHVSVLQTSSALIVADLPPRAYRDAAP